MVRGPGAPQGVVGNQFAANTDLAPTFAAWAGVPPPEGVDGRSINPLLSALPPSGWSTALLNERHLVEPDDSPSPDYDAVFTASGNRYLEYATNEKELYDLGSDPFELTNAYDPTVPPIDMASRLQALDNCAEETCRSAEDGP